MGGLVQLQRMQSVEPLLGAYEVIESVVLWGPDSPDASFPGRDRLDSSRNTSAAGVCANLADFHLAPSGLLQVQYSLNRFVKFIGPGLLMSIAYVVSVMRQAGCARDSR